MPACRIAATTLVLLLAAAVVPGQASAARLFDLFAGTELTRGDAHAYGALRFKRNARQVHVQGRLNDLCPKDGYGAYLDIDLWLGRGGERSVGYVMDKGGCKGGGQFFDITTPVFAAKVKMVNVSLREYDQESGRSGDGEFESISRRY